MRTGEIPMGIAIAVSQGAQCLAKLGRKLHKSFNIISLARFVS
jgi:hypothetical protein